MTSPSLGLWFRIASTSGKSWQTTFPYVSLRVDASRLARLQLATFRFGSLRLEMSLLACRGRLRSATSRYVSLRFAASGESWPPAPASKSWPSNQRLLASRGDQHLLASPGNQHLLARCDNQHLLARRCSSHCNGLAASFYYCHTSVPTY